MSHWTHDTEQHTADAIARRRRTTSPCRAARARARRHRIARTLDAAVCIVGVGAMTWTIASNGQPAAIWTTLALAALALVLGVTHDKER